MIPPLNLAEFNEQLEAWYAHVETIEPLIEDPERRRQLRAAVEQARQGQQVVNAEYAREMESIRQRTAAVERQNAEARAAIEAVRKPVAEVPPAASPPPAPIDPRLVLVLRDELLDRYARRPASHRDWPAVEDFSPEYQPLPLGAAALSTSADDEDPAAIPPSVVAGLLELAAVGSGDVIYHLGCGDGRVLISAASRFHARGFGADAHAHCVETAQARIDQARLQSLVSVKVTDPRLVDCTRATVVVVSLGTTNTEMLERTLRRQLRPGTRVVSQETTFKTWSPEQTAVVTDESGAVHHLHRWRIGDDTVNDSSIGSGGSVWEE